METNSSPSRGSALIQSLRLHHWAKNVLVFVPAIAGHRWDKETLVAGFAAFIAFGFCASAGYLLNDLFDRESDRQHPRKKLRPIASGALSSSWAMAAILVLLAASVAVGFFAGRSFLALLGIYFAGSLAYSSFLKRLLMVDVLALAGLYALRVFAGGYAANVPISPWLLVFSLFFFASLAVAKRVSEIAMLRQSGVGEPMGRGYALGDLGALASFGIACGGLSVLVAALYISGKDVSVLYAAPERLWFACPVLLDWIGRIHLLAHRGALPEDAILFASRDRASYVALLLLVVTLRLAI